jgi:hypothetical protein
MWRSILVSSTTSTAFNPATSSSTVNSRPHLHRATHHGRLLYVPIVLASQLTAWQMKSSECLPTRANSRSGTPIKSEPGRQSESMTPSLTSRRAALRWHPDRVAADSSERPQRTHKFKQVNEAYYTLSTASRRQEYDAARRAHGFDSRTDGPSSAAPASDAEPSTSGWGSFPWSSFGMGGGGGGGGDKPRAATEDDQFGSVFEEMLHEEGLAEEGGAPTGRFWSLVGGLSGGAMGFILANLPGAVAGAVAGNRLGAVRDSRGKSVYSVFQEVSFHCGSTALIADCLQLPQADKARLLSQLAAKVFSHAIS